MTVSSLRTCVLVVGVSAALIAGCQVATGELAPSDRSTTPAASHDPAPGPSGAPSPTVTMPALHPSVDGYPEGRLRIHTDGGTVEIAVRIADTAARRAHGLMEVPELPDGAGMLFRYSQDTTSSFWMENTLIPLDLAFIAGDGRIRQIVTMQPCDTDPCPTYPPAAPFREALEVPAGWFGRVGVEVGDVVTTLADAGS